MLLWKVSEQAQSVHANFETYWRAHDARRCSSCRFPLTVHLFKPKTKMGITGLQSWLQRRPAEFRQQDFACQSEGREGTLVVVCVVK